MYQGTHERHLSAELTFQLVFVVHRGKRHLFQRYQCAVDRTLPHGGLRTFAQFLEDL
jgi:hypothetical protein